jgi:hypothetical protein
MQKRNYLNISIVAKSDTHRQHHISGMQFKNPRKSVFIRVDQRQGFAFGVDFGWADC